MLSWKGLDLEASQPLDFHCQIHKIMYEKNAKTFRLSCVMLSYITTIYQKIICVRLLVQYKNFSLVTYSQTCLKDRPSVRGVWFPAHSNITCTGKGMKT